MVAHLLPKQRVAGSSPVSRSTNTAKRTRQAVSSFFVARISRAVVALNAVAANATLPAVLLALLAVLFIIAACPKLLFLSQVV
jgi:hypothetical protein